MNDSLYQIKTLQKSLINGNVNSRKYFVSCQNAVNDSISKNKFVDWITVSDSLKITQDYDKSRVLKAEIHKHPVIVKLGDMLIKNEYDISMKLQKLYGFVKFICHFTCDDDYIDIPVKKNRLCTDIGKQMHTIVMPFYELGSVGDYKWESNNVNVLQSLLKQTIGIVFSAWESYNFVHGDLHTKNILIKRNDANVSIKYGTTDIEIKTLGFSPVLMDFENSKFNEKKDNMSLNYFIIDLMKLFITMPTFIRNIDPSTITPITIKVNQALLSLNADINLVELFQLIDNLGALAL